MGSGTWATWVVYGILAFIIFSIVRAIRDSGTQKHCMTCGVDGLTKTRTRGSIFIEIVLWLCLIVPGLIYSIWRLTTKRQVCASCGAENIIPLDSPAAKNHRQMLAGGGPPNVPPRQDEYGWAAKQ